MDGESIKKLPVDGEQARQVDAAASVTVEEKRHGKPPVSAPLCFLVRALPAANAAILALTMNVRRERWSYREQRRSFHLPFHTLLRTKIKTEPR